MLAYVFWHWRRPDIPATDYVAHQRAFHRALAAAPPPGFVRSCAHTLTGAPWANGGAEAYEDWYLVRDAAALDALNEAAVTAGRRQPHDAAAAAAAGGTAGLYRLRLGEPLVGPATAWWFAKPAGLSYEQLWDSLAPAVAMVQGALWCRQMVLGPAPELCLHAPAEPRVSPAPGALRLSLGAVWPAGSADGRESA